jgi:hypothetical protein
MQIGLVIRMSMTMQGRRYRHYVLLLHRMPFKKLSLFAATEASARRIGFIRYLASILDLKFCNDARQLKDICRTTPPSYRRGRTYPGEMLMHFVDFRVSF